MTLSDKIRIYELSRDLNLDNKDILDAAQKLAINVKSHSSSISIVDAKKIKNLISKNNPKSKNIISVNKSSLKSTPPKKPIKQDEDTNKNKAANLAHKNRNLKESNPSKTLLSKPSISKFNSKNNITKKETLNAPQIISTSKPSIDIKNSTSPLNSKQSEDKAKQKNRLNNKNEQSPKAPKPPIQLIEKPKSFIKPSNDNLKNKLNNSNQPKNTRNTNTSRFDKNLKSPAANKPNKPISNTPELVGAPIRRDNTFNKQTPINKQNSSYKQTSNNRSNNTTRNGGINRPGSPNRANSGNRSPMTNRYGGPNRPNMPNRTGSQNRSIAGNRGGIANRPTSPARKGDFNKNGSKYSRQIGSGVRKPVAPNELMQLQKSRSANNEKNIQADYKKPKPIDAPKQKPKAPASRPNSIAPAKKAPHRTSNTSKKPGRTDWDDSAKLEALRNKSPQKQRQKVHIIGENDDSLTTETSGFAGEQKTSILSASLARPKKVKTESEKSTKSSKQLKKKKKETTRQRQKRRAMELRASREAKQVRPEMIIVPEDNLTVQELADKLSLESSEIIKSLFFKGITATVTQSLDLATIETVAEEFGVPVLQDDIEEAAKKTVDMIEKTDIDNLITRPPVVTVMGHVDHGKTSLLDSIRKSRIASGEAGGITQHIGAYQVEVKHESKSRKLTFLDTPGHAAFTAMRARGTKVTDIAVLVVAADDGVRPQTLEAISHARAAKVPIVVAINKIDKEGSSPDRVKQELSEKDLIAEDWGGDTVMVPVSAIKGQNIDKLLEMILLVSEVEDLQANPERLAKGTVIEAHLDKAKGPVATLLIQNGTLKSGDVLAAGSVLGRIRAMVDEHGNRIKEAAPSFPVEALGFSEVPTAGDEFEVYPDEKSARIVVGERATDARATKLAQQMASRRVSLSSLSSQANEGELKELNLILKADVQGSVEAILGSLEQLPKNEVQVRVLLSAPGEITETDIDLAAASGSVIIGFNTSLASGAKRAADANDVDIREYDVIYKLLEDIQLAMEGLLEPDLVEEPLGEAQVRAIFAIGKGSIAGCYVNTGKLQRNCSLRVRRKDQIIFEGNLDSLKRSKDDVKDVNTGFECGIGCDKFSNWNEGDVIEAFKLVTKKRTLSTN